MAAPMAAAAPMKDPAVKAKEDAIKRRLDADNTKAKWNANKALVTKKSGTSQYDVKKIAGADKGFTQSDYGVGDGAAIPYQIQTDKGTVTKHLKPPLPSKNTKLDPITRARQMAIKSRMAQRQKFKPEKRVWGKFNSGKPDWIK
jgi:hypothetical protein